MHRFVIRSAMALLAVLLALAAASPDALADRFSLHNHDDGNAAPPKYGLRLDGLYSGDGSDVFTFDFDHGTYGDMSLVVSADQTTITIDGTVYGGLNAGSGYATTGTDADKVGVWKVSFTYTKNVSSQSNGWKVTDDNAANSGYIERVRDKDGNVLTTTDKFDLADYTGSHNYSFKFLDVVHRGDGPWSGWGWLNHDWDRDGDIDSHISASDWLFTAKQVPEPGTLALLGLGITSLAVARRRRRLA